MGNFCAERRLSFLLLHSFKRKSKAEHYAFPGLTFEANFPSLDYDELCKMHTNGQAFFIISKIKIHRMMDY